MKKLMLIALSVLSILSIVSVSETKKEVTANTGPQKLNQTIYYSGDIITMEGKTPKYVEAVVQREGKIVFVGSKADALKKYKGKATEVDLKGKTLLPAFLDGHSHMYSRHRTQACK